jgi:glycosyltransferase involved in cell wall biosynthesis
MEPASVVIPTYNRAALLKETLASVAAALGDDDEIIVADNGSNDGTAEMVGAAGAPWHRRARYLRLAHCGAGRAFNAGIARARHDLIAFADSDDLWLPWRLALERPVMESDPDLAYCFSNFGQLTRDGQHIPHWLTEWSEDRRSWDEILAPGFAYAERWPLPDSLPAADAGFRVHRGSMYRQQLQRNYMCVNTLLVRRSAVGEALHFGEDLPRLADWECYARISREGDGAYLDVDTAVQRAHPGPRLTDLGPLPFAQSRLAVIERTWARDGRFMREHGHEVADLLASTRRSLARQLILANRRDEARVHVARLNGTLLERLALIVPHGVLVSVMEILSREA